MSESAHDGRESRVLLAAAAFVVIVAGMRAATEIIVPVLVAAFLAALCLPAFNWLLDRRVPAAASLCVIILTVVVIGTFVVAIIGNSVNDFVQDRALYEARIYELQDDAFKWLTTKGAFVWLKEHGINLDEIKRQQAFDTSKIFAMFSTMLGSLGALMSNAFVIFLLFVFILLEAAVFHAKLSAIGSGSSGERLQKIQQDIRRYLGIKTMVSLMTATAATVLLLFLGVDYAFLWGLLAFLLNFVPNIGSIIAAIPPVVLALIQPGLGLATACLAAIGFVVINVVIGNVIEPRVTGKSLGLSTLVVFLSLLFWHWVLGPVGMVLSVPLTMIVKIVLENTNDLRWVAILLNSKAPDPASTKA
jgi:predicted PurR-regulated permease PerM